MSTFHYIRRIYRELPKKLKLYSFFMVAIMVVSASLEALSAAILALYASSITDIQSVYNSKYMAYAKDLTGFDFNIPARNLLLILSLLTCGIVLLRNLFQAANIYISMRYVGSQEEFWGSRLFGQFLRLPYVWHMEKTTANLILAISWRAHIGRGYIKSFMGLLSDLLIILVMFCGLLAVQPGSSIAIIGVAGFFSWILLALTRRGMDQAAKNTKEIGKQINQETSKALYGIKDVKISDSGDFFLTRFIRQSGKYSLGQGYISLIGEVPALVLEFIGMLCICSLVVFMLFWQKMSTAMITGTVAMLAVTAWRVLPAVTRVLSAVTRLRSALPFVEKFFSYSDENPEISNRTNDSVASPIDFYEKIEFRDVSFEYPSGKKAFESINLEIMAGSTTGIIGSSGAGKSTFVDLLTGCLSPSGGGVFVDGVQLDSVSVRSWSRKIGYVPQSPYFYDGTLASNIAFGMPEKNIDLDRVAHCCEQAAMDFVRELPEGLNTWIGDGGVRLSGGQRQRIAIARALYRNPELLILDEATSSLDSKTEKEILDTVYSLKGNITLLVISHNMESVMMCDRLVWIDSGKVIMDGKPEEVAFIYKK